MKIPYYFLIGVLFFSCTKKNNKLSYGKETADSSFNSNNYIVSRIGLPDESPYTEVKKIVGVDMVTFKFYSPKVNNREILGNVVPFNKVWKISDYSPLQISSTSDFYIKDKKLKSGAYSVFLIPKKDSVWTLIINSETTSDKYDASKDSLKVDIKPVFGNFSTENLSVNFSKDSLNQADVDIIWSTFKIPLEIKFKNENAIFSSIASHFDFHKKEAKPISWDEYLEAAKFSLNNKLKLDTGLIWADSAVKLSGGNYAGILVEAQILSKQNKFDPALTKYNAAYQALKTDTTKNKDAGLKSISAQITGLKDYITNEKK
jgi:hypothetical protein